MKKLCLTSMLAATIMGCGGGSDTKSIPQISEPINASPVITPISPLTAVEITSLNLGVEANDSDGDISSYSWQQTGGAAVTLKGEATKEITIELPNVNNNEVLTFDVTVTDNLGASTTSTASITVLDRPNLILDSISIVEGDEGNTTFSLTAQLDKPWHENVTFDYNAEDISAQNNIDYSFSSGQKTITAGDLTATIKGTIIGDILYRDEDNTETFNVRLSSISGTDNDAENALVTIENDDMSQLEAYQDLKNQTQTLFEQLLIEAATIVANTPNTREAVFPKSFSVDAHADGDMDVVFTSSLYEDDVNFYRHHIEAQLFVNNQGKGFQRQSLNFVVNGRNIQRGDFDDNGLEDIYFTEHGYDFPPFPGHQDMLMLQTSSGVFEHVTQTHLPQDVNFGHGVCGGDLTGDNKVDLVTAAGANHNFLVNDGAGYFHYESSRLPMQVIDQNFAYENGYLDKATEWSPDYYELGYWECLVLDINDDGANDILYGGNVSQEFNLKNAYKHDANAKHLVLFNDGLGQFEYSQDNFIPFSINLQLERSAGSIDLEIMDFDGDNCTDFISFTTDYVHTSINVFINQCGSKIKESTSFNVPYWVELMEVTSPTKIVIFGWKCPIDNYTAESCPVYTEKTQQVIEYLNGKFEIRDVTESEILALTPASYVNFF
ncbi:FG-GAP repeat domain-containing protein [Pseudoalteromonas spongiae]|uniref:FG-GAP repeat domain-containing protein n=1 Tax=Pseudoalteromonas spongiae TaxID=298657 RepID=UPI0037352158